LDSEKKITMLPWNHNTTCTAEEVIFNCIWRYGYIIISFISKLVCFKFAQNYAQEKTFYINRYNTSVLIREFRREWRAERGRRGSPERGAWRHEGWEFSGVRSMASQGPCRALGMCDYFR